AATAEPAHPGLQHAERKRGRDHGVDAVATSGQHLGADVCGPARLRCDDAALGGDGGLADRLRVGKLVAHRVTFDIGWKLAGRVRRGLLGRWERRGGAAGWPEGWRLPDEVIEASRLAVLGDHRAGCDLWIYSYGSLMWDPGFHFAEVRLADVEGYQRRFTLKIN